MIRRVRALIMTIRHLTLRQIVGRLCLVTRRFRFPSRRVFPIRQNIKLSVVDIGVTWEGIKREGDAFTFRFLHRIADSEGTEPWSSRTRGLLWNYHTHYLNWLNIDAGDEVNRVYDGYIRHGYGYGACSDPYPTSLRIINVVKALSSGRITHSRECTHMINRDTRLLMVSVEYHLFGNHVLENGFGLLWAGFALNHKQAWIRGKSIVYTQLKEQVLEDGGHFERSPMYHSIILWRLLDTINLFERADSQSDVLPTISILRRYAERMLSWLHMYPLSEHQGHFNDSAVEMCPTKTQLLDYGRRLHLYPRTERLSESGFRVLGSKNALQILADVGSVGPSYRPGHAHAGTLAFELSSHGHPLLVDTGVSTYENNKRRHYERSTLAHNTVSIGHFDSSEVWSSFRVAERARVKILHDDGSSLHARHDGYRRRFGIFHQRSWKMLETECLITDDLTGSGARIFTGTAHFIVAPGVSCKLLEDNTATLNDTVLFFDGAITIKMEPAKVAHGFNKLLDTVAIRVRFKLKLITHIQFAA